MSSTLPSRRRFVLVRGLLMYGIGLSVLFTVAMWFAFRDNGAEILDLFLVGLAVLCPIGVLWAYFMYEFIARRYYARMSQRPPE